MTTHHITMAGRTFPARRGELLLDAALRSGLALPHDCRAGHCGTCCVRLVSGAVHGGEGAEPGVVHACQCRIAGDAVIESVEPLRVRAVEGVMRRMRALSRDVVEVAISTNRALPHHPGQYAQVRFAGYPSRPYSLTLPLQAGPDSRCVWFHIRRMKGGRVTEALGRQIKPGHRVTLTGPFGTAHFRPHLNNRLICVATNTGFAPIWSIALAALRENWQRSMLIVAGGRTLDALYMAPAMAELARFPNVRVVHSCSAARQPAAWAWPGRPTDYLPPLFASDVLYACGAPAMVDAVKQISARAGAVCYADPFLPQADTPTERGVVDRAKGWLASLPAAW